jgi:hypothetical protein
MGYIKDPYITLKGEVYIYKKDGLTSLHMGGLIAAIMGEQLTNSV